MKWKRRPLKEFDILCDYCDKVCKMKSDNDGYLCWNCYKDYRKENKEI